MPRWLVLLGLVAAATVSTDAVERVLNARSVSQAIDIGQSRIDAIRARFHSPYQILVSQPPVDYIDIVTPFRRVALAAEARARAGDRLFGQRDALAALGSPAEQIDVVVELTFHPYNTYVGVPDYDVRLLSVEVQQAIVAPRDVERIPRVGPRVHGFSAPNPGGGSTSVGGSAPLSGGTIVAHFDGSKLDPEGRYEVAIVEAGKVIAQGRVDLGQLR